MIDISVIIPIFNTAPYLERCINSLFHQTTTDNIEYIFINDASTDNSSEIIHKLISNYPDLSSQIKVIEHNTNKGILFTRNEGVSIAKGEYIIQIDSDDWIESNMFELMRQKANETNADIIGCDLFEEYPTASKYVSIPFDLPHDQLIKELITAEKVKSYLPIRMIRREHYLHHGMATPEGISLYEDRCICLPLHYYSKKTAHLPFALYHYRQTTTSLTKKITLDSFQSAWRSIQFMIDFLHRVSKYNLYRPQIESAKSNVAIWLIFRTDIYHPEIWNQIRSSLDISSLPIYKKVSITLVDKGYHRLNRIYVRSLRLIYNLFRII